MPYKIVSSNPKPVVVDGLGPVRPGEHVVSDVALKTYEHIKGLPLRKARLPEGVEVVFDVEESDTTKDKEG